jgi:signal transduction histidine kinase
VRNISDRKRAEEALQLSNEKLIATNKELERVTRLKDEFLATMSHELRTPLNAILGISEGLLDQVFGELNQRQQSSLKTIHKSGQHLLELINDVLDVAKIEAGMFTLDLTSVSVCYLCDSSLSFVKHLAIQKNIQLNLIIRDGVPTAIVVDERRMRQLLINLLSNAVKFTPKDGVITLEVRLCHLAQWEEKEIFKSELCFLVSDTGIGISQGDISKLFQPFVQIHSNLSRQYAGTGLGLNLVKKLAELHGGEVSVKSEVGQGKLLYHQTPL